MSLGVIMSQEHAPTSEVHMPDWSKVLWDEQYSIYYLLGGRKGSKTETIARYILIRMLQEPLRVFCVREYMANIGESVHDTFKLIIKQYGWDGWFKVTDRNITTPIGGEIFYGRMFNSKGSNKGQARVDITWGEEAGYFSRASIEELEPTVDRQEKTKLIYSFNVMAPDTPVYADAMNALKIKDPHVFVKKINYNDHCFLPDASLRNIVRDKLLKPESFAHKYLGEPASTTEGLVFHHNKHYRLADLDHKIHNMSPRWAIDWGKTTNATVLAKVYYWDNTVYVHSVIHGYGMRTHELPAFFAGSDTHKDAYNQERWHNPRPSEWQGLIEPREVSAVTIYCDWDTPNITELRDAGFQHATKVPYKNTKDSEWQSVEWIKNKDIVIHPFRCPLLLEELPLYSYAPMPGVPGQYDWKKFKAGNDNAVDAALRYPFFVDIFQEVKDDGGSPDFFSI